MKTAKEIIAASGFTENEVARIGYAVALHAQELDDCLALIEELRNNFFDAGELSTDCASAMFRLIQSTFRRFVDDLDTVRGMPSPYRKEYIETLIEQSK